MKRVGFIINSRVPEWAALRRGMRPHHMLWGWDDARSPMSFMRFRAVARALHSGRSKLRYELYRPGREYAAVVFLKSMGEPCLALARRLRARGTKILFEANVDYYTRFEGPARLDVMAPSPRQREDAVAITQFADAVIASSRHLAAVCAEFNPRSTWVPDNVDLAQGPPIRQIAPWQGGRLQVWWSGMASKLFEFLAAEEAFLARADRLQLRLVTDDLAAARARWPEEIRARLDRFLARMPHTLHRFRDVPRLLRSYAGGGVIVSPRFLDVPYNLSHTEWKISLGLAVGLPALASPVPSYRDVAAVASRGAVAICDSPADWHQAFDGFLENPASLPGAAHAAEEVVRRHYATEVVARRHAAVVESVLA